MSVISCESVNKSYGEYKALINLNLDVKNGECFGLLGPNGAGKSTLIRMLYGVSPKNSGDISVFDKSPYADGAFVRSQMGVVTQDNNLDQSMTVFENMKMYSRYMGVPKNERDVRIYELLEYMLLDHKKTQVIESLSGGMQRRLAFVRALLGRPKVLILDEPTTGLDPAVRKLLWDKIVELKDQGTTILLTTHYMDEAEVLCDRIVIMDKGEVKEMGAPKDLIHKICPGYIAIVQGHESNCVNTSKKLTNNSEETLENMANNMPEKIPKGIAVKKESDKYLLVCEDLEYLTRFLSSNKMRPEVIRPRNLEDVFLEVTGRELTENA